MDPLDAFMAGLVEDKPRSVPRPERLDETARDEAEDGRRTKVALEQEDEDARKKLKISHLLDPFSAEEDEAAKPPIDETRWNGTHVGEVRPMTSFDDLDAYLPALSKKMKRQFSRPTKIQSLLCPAALVGRDVVARSPTGSGKTLAYGWPALARAAHQQRNEGPISLILVPTRELSEQVYRELKKFEESVSAVFGGSGKWEMSKAIRRATTCVATPGRLIELVSSSHLLRKCSYLCIDEADRMFDLGFKDQVASIARAVRPSKQMIVCSATMRDDFERVLPFSPRQHRRCRIIVERDEDADSSSAPVVENVVYVEDKLRWVRSNISSLGRCLVFVSRRVDVEWLADKLPSALCLHGNMDKDQRSLAVNALKTEKRSLLIATDLAGRGLDVKNLDSVVNYDTPKDMDAYYHRIGRLGRDPTAAQHKGVAHTLLTSKDSRFAQLLSSRLRDNSRRRITAGPP